MVGVVSRSVDSHDPLFWLYVVVKILIELNLTLIVLNRLMFLILQVDSSNSRFYPVRLHSKPDQSVLNLVKIDFYLPVSQPLLPPKHSGLSLNILCFCCCHPVQVVFGVFTLVHVEFGDAFG